MLDNGVFILNEIYHERLPALKDTIMKNTKKWLFFPALAVGVAVLAISISLREDIPVEAVAEKAKLVDTMELKRQPTAPIVTGFGVLTPKYEWKAISEVKGAVIYRHPDLEKGKILPAGTEVLRIDPTDYEVRLVQAEADYSSSVIQLKKLDLELQNLKSTLAIEKSRLALVKKELDRRENLVNRGLASQSTLDAQQQTYLAQKKLVQEMSSQLKLMPEERKVIQTTVKTRKAGVTDAKNLLAKTIVVLPQTLRIAEVNVEQNQVVNMQQAMIVGHNIDKLEVDAQLSIHDLQTLSESAKTSQLSESNRLPSFDGFEASITLSSGSLRATYPAKVARLSDSVDVNQATAGIILEVEQVNAQESNNPLLVNGMFVQAEITGLSQLQFQIPERALHGNLVYIANSDMELEIREVTALYRVDGKVVISGDITQGELLVLNDLLPPVIGMKLKSAQSSEEKAL